MRKSRGFSSAIAALTLAWSPLYLLLPTADAFVCHGSCGVYRSLRMASKGFGRSSSSSESKAKASRSNKAGGESTRVDHRMKSLPPELRPIELNHTVTYVTQRDAHVGSDVCNLEWSP